MDLLLLRGWTANGSISQNPTQRSGAPLKGLERGQPLNADSLKQPAAEAAWESWEESTFKLRFEMLSGGR